MDVVDEETPLLPGHRRSYRSAPSSSSATTRSSQSQRDRLPRHSDHQEAPILHSLDQSLMVDEGADESFQLLTSPRHQWYSSGESLQVHFETASPFQAAADENSAQPLHTEFASTENVQFFSKLPGLLIALLLNLFLSISFGQAFFPTEWEFPSEVPRAVGIQMFLFSTIICQLVMTAFSDFPCAMGMMMVENIPFMHTIANTVLASQGKGIESFSTILMTFALSSVICGVLFYVLGAYKLGNIVYYFPRHVIVGCIGGVGVFVTQTGFEVSCNQTWTWTVQSVRTFAGGQCYPLWLASCLCVVGLRLGEARFRDPLLPPLYFVAIPPMFYLVVYTMGISIDNLTDRGWFFESAEHAEWDLQWKLIRFEYIDWWIIVELFPTILALTVFSLMHVPINIPSLSMSTKMNSDMNSELKAHGVSNILSGCCGGLQNYLCYSNSLLYFKCNGGGKLSGYLLAIGTTVFFVFGPSIISFVPRCMAGCLLIHVGIDLFSEAIFDSYGAFDRIEYASVILITAVMSIYGMTAGLGVGCVLAAFTFTFQTQHHTKILRGQMSAITLRSTARRSERFTALLQENAHRIHVMQLQGNLFFGNATMLSAEISKIVQENQGQIWCLLLDFTLVVGIDSSAVETVANIPIVCGRHGVKVCFARGSVEGFPCEVALTDRLHTEECCKDDAEDDLLMNTRFINVNERIHISDDLNTALLWCENQVVVKAVPAMNPIDPLLTRQYIRTKEAYLRQMYFLYPDERTVDRIIKYFEPRDFSAHEMLWKQGSSSTCAILVVKGRVVSELEDEAGTKTVMGVGYLLGEYGLVNNRPRFSTLRAHPACKTLVLRRDVFTRMEQAEPELAYALARICMGYLEYRVQHVANRIWESRCLPL